MFNATFKYELRHWMRQPSVYIFAFFMCLLPMLQMAEWAGVMKEVVQQDGIDILANSPIRIWSLFNKFSILILFLLPVIFGQAIQRDFRQNAHSLLYSFPLQKRSYLFAKFLSALVVVLVILLFFGLGTFIGTQFPGHDSQLVKPFSFSSYATIYGVYLLPNILLLGSFIFTIVLLSRNVYAGFVMVLLFYFLQTGVNGLFASHEVSFAQALLDPFGNKASQYFTQHWTLRQQNQLPLPFESVIIWNRIIWFCVSTLMMGLSYRLFNFSKDPIQIFSWQENSGKGKSNNQKVNKQSPTSLNSLKINTFQLVKVRYDYSFFHNLKATWQLTQFNLSYILKNGAFVSILLAGIAIVIFKQADIAPSYGEATLPITWKMLRFPLFNFSGTINILTFLFTGMLIHRSRMAHTHYLVDSSPIPNWVLMLSNFMAIILMQFVLLSLVLIGGIGVQIWNGYYHFNITQYLFELFALNWVHFIIWAFLAFLVQSFFRNPYLGFFMLIIALIGFAHTHIIGLDHNIFRYNMGPNYSYSDILGYGNSLLFYGLYKAYWFIAGLILWIGAYAFWVRGIPTIKERQQLFISRLEGRSGIILATLIITFVGLGASIWYEDQVLTKTWTKANNQIIKDKINSTFVKYEKLPQPTTHYAKFWMDIFPNEQNFKLKGTYNLVNEPSTAIDTLLIITPLGYNTNFSVAGNYQTLFEDTTFIRHGFVMDFQAIHLAKALAPNDSIAFHFEMENLPATLLRKKSPVNQKMTQFVPPTIPRIGYSNNAPLPMPSDSTAALKMYEAINTSYLNFETTISTDKDQVAIAPGTLVNHWEENERNYYHYKTTQPTPFYLSFISGEFEVKKDKWKTVDLEIYHHKNHHHNLAEFTKGMKAALEFNSKNFGEYPLDVARLVEYPINYGRGGKAFHGICSVSEFAFISKLDDDPNGANYPFFIAAHEMSHQWWMHQLNPANALGAEMILESLCQYTALKCIEKELGKKRLKSFLINELAWYENGVRNSKTKEPPLMYNDGEPHISYAKGSLVFYVLNEKLGEEKLNQAIKNFFQKFKGQQASFATSIDLVNEIRKVAPPELQELITELFEKPGFLNGEFRIEN